MSTVAHDVLDSGGKKVGSVDLLETVFAAKSKPSIVHQVVRWQRAKSRAGTHSALNRAAKQGGGKKPFKQKGTGNARAGSSNSPVWVGGAVAHGPQPRSYEFAVPRRVRSLALCSALSAKKQNEKLVVLDELSATGKTKEIAAILKAIGASDKKALLVVSDLKEDSNKLVLRAAKNLAGVKAVPAAGVNVYDLVKADYLVCSKAGLDALQGRFVKAKED